MIKYLSVSFVYFCFYIKKIRAILFEFLPSLSISHYYYFVEQIAQKKKKTKRNKKKDFVYTKKINESKTVISVFTNHRFNSPPINLSSKEESEAVVMVKEH